jgi:hypothetical protein
MKEVKSVRIRKRNLKIGTLDIKVTLYSDKNTFGPDDIILVGINNDNPVWVRTTYKKSGIYKDFTDDQFIDNFISSNSKMDGSGSIYDIIQDPWEITTPKWRNFGNDPYYLNNGVQVTIHWVDNGFVSGGTQYSDSEGNELTIVGNITKYITIMVSGESKYTLDKNETFQYLDTSLEFYGSKSYKSSVKDKDILNEIISKWKIKIPNYDELSLCSPDNESCSIISYKSPLKPIEPESTDVVKFATNETPKEKINVILSTTPIKTKIDTSIKIYIGNPKEIKDSNPNNTEDEFEGLSDEYTETNFEGLDEVEYNIQEQVADGQEDSDSEMGTVGAPANIRPVNGLDELLKLAGECARELGKSPKVKYENLKRGYTKGIHGLCPQGTLSVLYALTGIKKIGMTRGNADTFSFRGNSILGESYFDNKVRVGKSYFDQSANWQIGDVVAVGYTGGKPYGHIQVWTGICWMSDFKQNGLQRNHVDWETAALWRANSKGIAAINRQSGQYV